MNGSTVAADWRLALLLTALAALAVGVGVAGRLGTGRAVLIASARATLQLAVVASVVGVVVAELAWSAVFVLVMLTVATGTAAHRVTGRVGAGTAAPVALGALPVVLGCLGSGVVPWDGLALIPIAGIVIGAAMTATTLSGRRALDELAARRGEVEAGLALGLEDRDARLEVIRPRAAEALVPGLDQTRTVGLVTLPGAFVGMLLGGATPLQAGAVQLLVLVGLLAAQSVAVVVTVELVARGRLSRSPAATPRRSPGPAPGPAARPAPRAHRRPAP